MRIRSLILTALFVLGCASLVSAQETVTSYELQVFAVGGTTPIMTPAVFSAADAVCGQPKVAAPTGTVLNPTTLVWDDKADATKDCIYRPAGDQVLLAFPAPSSLMQNYEAVLVAKNAAGLGAGSNRAPFSRLSAPAARTGLRLGSQ